MTCASTTLSANKRHGFSFEGAGEIAECLKLVNVKARAVARAERT